MRRIAAVLAFIFLAAGRVFPAEIADATGRVFDIPENPRIVALTPAVADIAARVGAAENLVGVSAFSPNVGRNARRVGSVFSPDYEAIVSLRPDAVVCSEIADKSVRARLESCGVNFFAVHADGLDNIEKNVRLIGAVCGRDGRARQVADEFRARTAPQNLGGGRRALFVFASVAAGKGSFVSDLMERFGFANCAQSAGGAWPMLHREFVVKANPEVIFAAAATGGERAAMENLFKTDAAWRSTAAARNSRIFFVDAKYVMLPSVGVAGVAEVFKRAEGVDCE